MKTQIRRGVFETNSSSIHTLTISKNLPDDFKFPKEVVFGKGPDACSDFAKEYDGIPDTYSNPVQGRLDGIYRLLLKQSAIEFIKLKKAISDFLGNYGIHCIFNEDCDLLVSGGFIDEDELEFFETGDLMMDVITGKLEEGPLLLNYLFGNESQFRVFWTDDYPNYLEEMKKLANSGNYFFES